MHNDPEGKDFMKINYMFFVYLMMFFSIAVAMDNWLFLLPGLILGIIFGTGNKK